jgi:opacity protein-like surface antigen
MLASAAAQAEPSKLPPEVGWNYGEMETTRAAGLGGAVRALATGPTALYFNPANLAAARDYRIEAMGQIWPEAKRQSYGAAVADARINPSLAGGVGANYTWQDNDGLKRKALDLRVGLAMPISDKFFLGAAGRYTRILQDGLGPLGPSYASGGRADDPLVQQFTFDAGLSIRPSGAFAIGLVGNNLTFPGHAFLPTTIGGGVGVSPSEGLSIEGNLLADLTTYDKTTWRASGGAEFVAAERFPLRFGYRFDEGQKSHALGGGVGYSDAQFGVSLSLRRTISGEASTTVVFGLEFLLDMPSPGTVLPSPGGMGQGPLERLRPGLARCASARRTRGRAFRATPTQVRR